MDPNGLEVVYKDATAQYRRVRFEPTDDGYRKETAVHTGCSWRVTGAEPVSDVTIDAPPEGNHEFGPEP